MRVKKDLMPFKSVATKDKYNIQKDDVIVVEKNNNLKFVINVLIAIGKIIIYIILLFFAFIGVISLILPETRELLLYQASHLYEEFFSLLGGN